MEEPESALRNLYRTYMFYMRPESQVQLRSSDKNRWLGGMEALLQCLGVLPSGILHDLQPVQKKFLFIPYTTTESYDDFILRKCDEFIKTSPNTPSLR